MNNIIITYFFIKVKFLYGGKRGYRTHVLWFFRPALRPHKLSSHIMEAVVGFEPTIKELQSSALANLATPPYN